MNFKHENLEEFSNDQEIIRILLSPSSLKKILKAINVTREQLVWMTFTKYKMDVFLLGTLL